MSFMPCKLDASILGPADSRGRLVVFCGINGSGKTTLANRLRMTVAEKGYSAEYVNLLSTGIYADEAFKTYIADPVGSVARKEVDVFALTLKFLADRLQNFRLRQLPQIQSGKWIICDRYVYTSLAEYLVVQSVEREIKTILDVISMFPRPDMSIITTAPLQTCASRLSNRGPGWDTQARREYLCRLDSQFQAIARQNSLCLLDTSEELAESVRRVEVLVEQIA